MTLATLLSERGRDYFYIMHLSYNGQRREELWSYARANRMIGLDAPRIVRDSWTNVRESAERHLGPTWVRQFDTFCNEMLVGDLVLALNGWDSLLGVAEIIEPKHIYDRTLSDTETFFDHIRRVKWIRQYEYNRRRMLPEPLRGFNNTLSKINLGSSRWQMLVNLAI